MVPVSMLHPPWPDASGDYLLLWQLTTPVPDLPIARLGRFDLAPGTWAYCGSARGPGGLRARIERHLRPGKAAHWHIDHLTAALPPPEVIALPEAASRSARLECRLVDQLVFRHGFDAPILGFGNGDCRSGCPAHLLHHGRRIHPFTLRRWVLDLAAQAEVTAAERGLSRSGSTSGREVGSESSIRTQGICPPRTDSL